MIDVINAGKFEIDMFTHLQVLMHAAFCAPALHTLIAERVESSMRAVEEHLEEISIDARGWPRKEVLQNAWRANS